MTDEKNIAFFQKSLGGWNVCENITQYCKPANNVLTVILDMIENTMHFKLNDVTLPYGIRGIPHVEKNIAISVRSDEIIFVISTTYLKHVSIDKTIEIKYHSLY
jgi:hypothetical protein